MWESFTGLVLSLFLCTSGDFFFLYYCIFVLIVAVLTHIYYFLCSFGVYLTSFKNRNQTKKLFSSKSTYQRFTGIVLSNAYRSFCHDAIYIHWALGIHRVCIWRVSQLWLEIGGKFQKVLKSKTWICHLLALFS